MKNINPLPAEAAAISRPATSGLCVLDVLASQWAVVMNGDENGLFLATSHAEFMAIGMKQGVFSGVIEIGAV